jgi:hypothetical protein
MQNNRRSLLNSRWSNGQISKLRPQFLRRLGSCGRIVIQIRNTGSGLVFGKLKLCAHIQRPTDVQSIGMPASASQRSLHIIRAGINQEKRCRRSFLARLAHTGMKHHHMHGWLSSSQRSRVSESVMKIALYERCLSDMTI